MTWDPLAGIYARIATRDSQTAAERAAGLAAEVALFAAIGSRAADLLAPPADPDPLLADFDAWIAAAPAEDDTLCDMLGDLS